MIRAIAALLAVLAILIGGATPVSAADRSPIVVGRGVAVACPADESVGYVLVPGTREIFNCPRSITLPDTSTEPAAAEDPTPALFFLRRPAGRLDPRDVRLRRCRPTDLGPRSRPRRAPGRQVGSAMRRCQTVGCERLAPDGFANCSTDTARLQTAAFGPGSSARATPTLRALGGRLAEARVARTTAPGEQGAASTALPLGHRSHRPAGLVPSLGAGGLASPL